MISVQTLLKVTDNSKVKKVQCIKTYNYNSKGFLGNIILVSIKTLKTLKNKTKLKDKLKIVKGGIFKALIVRTVYKKKNSPNNLIKFDENSVILLNNSGQPFATRIFGPITMNLRQNKKVKVLSLSSNII